MFKSLRASAAIRSDTTEVLVVEDQRMDRERLIRMCRSLGMKLNISTAATLAHAAMALGQKSYDLIFLDYSLPDGTGIDALDIIGQSDLNRAAGLIMITGHQTHGLAAQALAGGCSDYLAKDDLNPENLKRAVGNALQKSQLTHSAAAETQARQEVEEVLQEFSTQCARDIKPMVSRMMRQLRNLRQLPPDAVQPRADKCAQIEGSCMQLWEFLVALERHQGPGAMADFSAKPIQTTTGIHPTLSGRA